MERGSDKHGPRTDDELAAEVSGQLGAGGHREEWAETELLDPDDDTEDVEVREVAEHEVPRPDLDQPTGDPGATGPGR